MEVEIHCSGKKETVQGEVGRARVQGKGKGVHQYVDNVYGTHFSCHGCSAKAECGGQSMTL